MIAIMSTALVPARQGIPLQADRDALAAENHRSTLRMLTAIALSPVMKQSAESIVTQNWPTDATASVLTRAATPQIDTTNSGLPALTAVRLLPSLAPGSAASRLFAQAGIKLDFSRKALFSLPHLGTLPEPVFVGEGGAFPVVQGLLAALAVGPTRKLGFMVPVSNELANYAVEDAYAIFSRLMTDTARLTQDKAVFSSAAGSALRPPGLLNGVSPLTPTTGGGLAALVGDLKQLVGKIASAGIDSDNAVIVTHPEQAEVLGTLPPQPLKRPVYGTAAVPVGTVIMIAPDAVATGYDGNAMIFMSPDAAAHMESETPQDIGTPGTPPDPNSMAVPTQSSFQTDTQLLKLVVRCAWGARTGAVQYIENATW
jgi:hypothetical protein